MNRRWITREEIAEIHDQRIRMVAQEYSQYAEGDVSPEDRLVAAGVAMDKMNDISYQAAVLRQIDKLDNPLGQRAS